MENNEQRPQEEEEEVNLTLALFDLYWFRSLILLHLPPSPQPPPRPTSPPPMAEVKIEDAESCNSSPTSASLRLSHRRSLSEDLSPSPTLQIQPPKLQTTLSGKVPSPGDNDEISMFEVTVEEHGHRWKNRKNHRHRRRRRTRQSESSKSLSELEFKELKGFMDLGFTFSDADTDPRLMEIVPGLQRLKEAAAVGGDKEPWPPQPAAGDGEAVPSSASADDVALPRPYLSEAWDAVEEEEEVNRLRNFKIPMAEDEVDLKDQLRFWAHAVASSVR